MKKELNDLKPEQQAALKKLAAMQDDMIDYTDIPETTAEDWRGAKRMADFRVVKKAGLDPA